MKIFQIPQNITKPSVNNGWMYQTSRLLCLLAQIIERIKFPIINLKSQLGFVFIQSIVFVTFLSGISTFFLPESLFEDSKTRLIKKTASEIHLIQQAGKNYYKNIGSWPSDIISLQNTGFLPFDWDAKNPWGHPYHTSNGGTRFLVSVDVPQEEQKSLKEYIPDIKIDGNNMVYAQTLPPGQDTEKTLDSYLPWDGSKPMTGDLTLEKNIPALKLFDKVSSLAMWIKNAAGKLSLHNNENKELISVDQAGNTTFKGDLTMEGNLSMQGDLSISSNAIRLKNIEGQGASLIEVMDTSNGHKAKFRAGMADGDSLAGIQIGSETDSPISFIVGNKPVMTLKGNKIAFFETNSEGFGLRVASTTKIDMELIVPVVYDSDETSYYIDPASESVLNTIIASKIFDDDNRSYFIDQASTSVLNNLELTNLTVKGGTINNLDSNYRWTAGSNFNTFNTPSGYIQLGPGDSSHAHINTDKDLFSFNKGANFAGGIKADIFYDRDDASYFINPAGASSLNTLTANTLTLKSLELDSLTTNSLKTATINGQLPILTGNISNYAVTQLTAGDNVSLSGTTGSVTISTVQNPTFVAIDTGQGANELYAMNQNVRTTDSPAFAGITLNNTGLQLLDTNASHTLVVKPGSDITLNRTLTVTTGDADRTITLSGNPTLDDWFDQSIKTTASPTFVAIDTGQGANELYAMNQNVRTTDSPAFAGVTLSTSVTTPLIKLGSSSAPSSPSAGNIYSNGTDIYFYNGSSWEDLTAGGGGASDKIYEGDSIVEVVDTADGYITFIEDNSEVLRITGSNVGIGTANPGAKLEVVGGIVAETVNTGQGANELYAMNQNVRTTDSPAFAGVTLNNTGLQLLDTNASHALVVKPGSDITLNRTLTVTTGDADRTITLSGNPTLGDWFDQSVKTTASPTFVAIDTGQGANELYAMNQNVRTTDSPAFAGVTLNNTGLQLLDTNASHALVVKPGSDITLNRTLTVTTGDADRTITLSGNPTLGDWFDQSVKTTASPTFVAIDTGQGANELYAMNQNVRTTDSPAFAGVTLTNGNMTLNKSDPTVVLDAVTAGDTDFWLGVQDDGLGTDNDLFQIGKGTTPGLNPFITINNVGNVGIGTTNPTGPGSPGSMLQILRPTGKWGIVVKGDTGQQSDLLLYTPANTTDRRIAQLVLSTDDKFYLRSVTDAISVANNFLVADLATGNVGIGTTTPGAKLDVAGNIRSTSGSSSFNINNDGVNSALTNNVGATLFYNNRGGSDTSLVCCP